MKKFFEKYLLIFILALMIVAIIFSAIQSRKNSGKLLCADCHEELLIDGHVDNIDYYHCSECGKEYIIRK